MDFACSFQHSHLFRANGCRKYGATDMVLSKPGFRMSGLDSKYLSAANLASRRCVAKSAIRTPHSGNLHFSSRSNSMIFLSSKPLSKYSMVKLKTSAVPPTKCQGNDSLAFIDGNDKIVDSEENTTEEETSAGLDSNGSGGQGGDGVPEVPGLDELKELLQKARRELEVCMINSTMFEEKAQKISETAIALKDEELNARNDVVSALNRIQLVAEEETSAKEAVQKATMALSLAEARLKVALESLEVARARCASPLSSDGNEFQDGTEDEAACLLKQEEESLFDAQTELKTCSIALENCQAELKRLQNKKDEFQKEVDRLTEVADQAHINALKADEDVANIMLLAEQAVAFEVEATKRVNDAEIALQRAERSLASSQVEGVDRTIRQSTTSSSNDDVLSEDNLVSRLTSCDDIVVTEQDMVIDAAASSEKGTSESYTESYQGLDQAYASDSLREEENEKLGFESSIEADLEVEKSRNMAHAKKQEAQKDVTRDTSPANAPKASLNKSSRFFSASFFSFDADDSEFSPASVFHDFIESAKKQMPKLIVGFLLLGAGVSFYATRVDKRAQMFQQSDVLTTSVEEVSSTAKPLMQQLKKIPKRVMQLIEKLPHQEINEEEASLFDVLWLLLASVIFVPIFQKIPGGSPVLGYLAAGILIGPYGLSIIRHVHGTKAIAEFGVVFLLFNIGLELSVERLSFMKKYVFGLGSAQVLVTAAVVGLVARFFHPKQALLQ